MSETGESVTREVLLLTTGGTISMSTAESDGDSGATPVLGSEDLLAGVPQEVRPKKLRAETLMNRPSIHLSPGEQLDVVRRARDAARLGLGVVVTHGTDTLEETAMLADIIHDAEAPIVFTGAIRTASLPGADGPANLADSLAVAASPEANGLGAVVCFGGEIHHARTVRKSDAVSPTAFTSPQSGPVGRISEGRVRVWSRSGRNPHLDPDHLDFLVPIVPCFSGDDGRTAAALLEHDLDGAVVVALGAGHLSPAALAVWADATSRIPVVATVRPERGSILHSTYGYEGSERDIREAGIVPAGFLSPQAARIKLLTCLGSGLRTEGVARAFSADDR